MTCPAIASGYETSTANRLNPPRVRLPKLVQGLALTVFRRGAMRYWIKRYGPIIEFNVPFFGQCVAVSDPGLVRLVCTANTEQLSNYQPNLSNCFGPGSIFALDGSRHHARRRLLAPAFHGRSLKNHEAIIVEEILHESANWPENKEFGILEPMHRITLNVILRTIFGAEGGELEQLREIVARYANYGSAIVKFMPVPKLRTQRYSPWRKFDEIRRAFDRIIFTLIDRAEADPELGQRTDVLAVLLCSRPADGTGMSRQDICDELVTLIGAGHETTTSALSWAFERLRRHPAVLAELVNEVDEGGSDFRRATILEVLRVRPVIDLPGRRVSAPHFDLGAVADSAQSQRIREPRRSARESGESFLTPKDSIRTASGTPSSQHRHGWRSDTVHAGVWVLISQSTKSISCCGQCCSISGSTPTPPLTRSRHFRGVTYAPKRGGRVVLTRRK